MNVFPGNHVTRDQGLLRLGGVTLSELAARFGTPLYVYDFDRIKLKAEQLIQALHRVSSRSRGFYAMKALSNLSVIKTIHDAGLGMDVVSGGEIERALAAGIKGSDIVFSGVAKTTSEIELGIREGIACFNIESPHELETLIRLAANRSRTLDVALRVNPDVDGKTHAKINTGLAETKFGLSPHQAKALAKQILAAKNLKLVGVSCHIGSQILDLGAIKTAALFMKDFANDLLAMGAPVSHIDMGGGLGVSYRPDEVKTVPTFLEWISAARLALPDPSFDLYLEPGRSIVGDAGVLVTRVIDIKQAEKKTFAIVDAGMTDLIRPALYDAYHHIEVASTPSPSKNIHYDVVGPVCETSCWIATNASLPELSIGDLLAVMTAGAYGMTMASHYNSRPKPAEIAVENKLARVIRQRETLSSLWDAERFENI